MKIIAPQLLADKDRSGFGWIDVVVLLVLFGLLWSTLHFGRGMLVGFDASAVAQLDFSTSQIPYYAGRTLLGCG